jgi:hypothetical protein
VIKLPMLKPRQIIETVQRLDFVERQPAIITITMAVCAGTAIRMLLQLVVAVLGIEFVHLVVDDIAVAPREFLEKVGVAYLVLAVLLFFAAGGFAANRVWTRELIVISCGVAGRAELGPGALFGWIG